MQVHLGQGDCLYTLTILITSACRRHWRALRPALLGVALAGLAACAGNQVDAPQGKKGQVLWPAAPDQPRFIYEALLRSEANITVENEQQALRRKLVGAPRSNAPVIDKPSAIVARDGRVYVAEPSVKAVTVFDGVRGKLFRFGLREPNSLRRPQALALDAGGLVYVLDSELRQVMVFDELGLFQFSIDVKSGFVAPVALAVSPDGQTIYVVDRGDLSGEDHKVVAFAPDGKEKFRLGPRGSENGKFNIPLAATVAADGSLVVADSGNFRIQTFDADGKFKASFGGSGSELGRFSRPRSIATDSEGNIYVADSNFNNVQIFNAKGELLMPLGRLSRDPGPGNYSLLAGIAVDNSNRLFVLDHYFKKIEIFRRLSHDEGVRLMAKSP